MCGRYTVTVAPEELGARFGAEVPPEAGPRYNAAPSQTLPVMLNEDKKVISLLRWGLVPRWSKDPSTGYKMINARSETLTEKPSYREPFKKRRCLVLADSFYEWQKTPSGKVPMRIMLKSGEPFAFAGLWEAWHDPESDAVLRTFTIITCGANDLVKPIHERMPVILPRESEAAWLDNSAGEKVWKELLRPYAAASMQTYAVSSRVNAAGVDDPALIQPA